MSWPDSDRRGSPRKDSGERRRRKDFEELASQLLQTESDLRETHERLEDAEGDVQSLHLLVTGLLTTVGNIDGKVDVLTDLCQKIDGKTGFNWTSFLATVIVPLFGLLLTAYIALRLQAPQALPGGSP